MGGSTRASDSHKDGEDWDDGAGGNPQALVFDAQVFKCDFQRIFESEPREIQTNVARWMHDKGTHSTLVAEISTGGGKTRIAAYRIACALRAGFKRGIYTCSTKSLQFQVATEAKSWNVGPVVCLYGKANYWCHDRLQRRLRTTTDEKAKAVLRALVDVEVDLFPPKELFENECKGCRLLDGEKVRALWESITADSEQCNCYGEMWQMLEGMKADERKQTMLRDLTCYHGLQRLRAEDASLFVINMSLFLTYARHGVVMKRSDYLCIDEAHELAKWASSCFEDCLPKALDISNMNEFLARCGSLSPFSVNRISASDFPCQDSLPFSHAVGAYIKTIKSKFSTADLTNLELWTDGAMHIYQRLQQLVLEHESTEKVLGQLQDPSDPTVHVRLLCECVCNEMRNAKLCGHQKEWLQHARGALQGCVSAFAGETQSRSDAFALATRLSGTVCTFQELLRSLVEVRQACAVIQVAGLASDMAWTTSQQSGIIPLACETGVRYMASSKYIADKLRDIVWRNVRGALLMSATIASCDPTDQPSEFKIFCNEVGLDEESAFTHAFPEVFDKSEIRVCAPYIGKYDARNENRRKAFMSSQVGVIDEYLNALPPGKSALVISPSLTEIVELQGRLTSKVNEKRHIMFSNRVEYDKFVRSPSSAAIIYGSDSLSTGVDLPGRVGLVVITRPWNPIPDQVKQSYERTYLGVSNDSYWKYYRYRRDRKGFQAAGRLQRCETDHGTILFLGEPMETRPECSSERLLRKWGVSRSIERVNKIRRV
tara:strand:- start:1203 stop:3515 length:2313 start_codon:yes stop_codon:yes gene_type:complete